MDQRRDIATDMDIENLVNLFYENVRQDEMLAPIFNERIGDRWAEHLPKMYAFWGSALLGKDTYRGSPFPHHARLPIDHAHFSRWLELFNQATDQLFTGEKADEAKFRASKMAELFEFKIDYIRKNGMKNLM
ncbi:MAG TPA: group III truncated hemoglobin [Chryseolinea sp.]|nr:group III truncated hemoglobin [Chryseolinea sp.]